MSRRKYVAVTGAIGAGASTLAMALHTRLGWQTYDVEQAVDVNPFFTDAYADFPRWGFHSQISFMTTSFQRHQVLSSLLSESRSTDHPIIEDRTPFEHCDAYLPAYVNSNLISAREAALLERVGAMIQPSYVAPDVLVFRRMTDEQLVSRVRERRRPGEEAAEFAFLDNVRVAFEDMAQKWTRSTVVTVDANVDVLDPEQGASIVEEIKDVLAQTR